MSKQILTYERLREVLDYDPETGVTKWKIAHHRNARIGEPTHFVTTRGYASMCIDKHLYSTHRLIWLYYYKVLPVGDIDHLNGIRTDNRIANLRDVSRSGNLQNLRKAKSTSSTGLLGVCINKDKWQARITVQGRQISLGTYITPLLAHQAYLVAKRQLHPTCTI